ncbi:hypothetical protein BDF21DRAFT_345889 [Thamnidium elegans]|nr:hypothetical protein BDF21DRAFT_345889 [Thamnidium elegans]
MAFQRKSHLLNDKLALELRKNSFKRPLWVTSFTTFLVANIIGSIFSIGYLPIVILAPIGAMGLVFNAIAAKIVLGDPFLKKTVIGTCLIVIGALLVGLFGVIPEPDHDIDDLIRLYKKPAFIAYFSILEFIILTGLLTTHYFERLYHLMESATLQPNNIGKFVGKWVSMQDLKKYIGISFGVLSGNISSQSILFAKSGLELILLTVVQHKNQLNHALTWILLVMMIVTAILQLYYLNKGLQFCDTVILIPLSSCTFNVSCLFNGLVYYDQWDRLRWWQLLLVMLGVTITICGVLMISWRSSTVNTLVEEEVDVVNNITSDETTSLIGNNKNTPYT